MATELRKTGISVVGDIPWGTHFCHFYETKQDLLDTLVPYFKAGLESKEFCLWVVSDSDLITVEEAKAALAQAVPDLDRHLSDENIEIVTGLEWYLEKNVFNLERVTSAWDAKLKRALALGYEGMRVSGDTFWLAEKDWKDFCAYEKQLNDSITDQPMTVLCTYPLAKSGAAEVLDVVQAHQFAIARRQGEWEVIETPELIQAKAEIRRLNDELEQRVVERTNELRSANEELSKEIAERMQADNELRQQKEILQQIFDHIPVMISFVDADGHLKLVNREWERALGWSLDEIRQQNIDVFAECYPDPQYRQQVQKFVAEAKGEGVDFKIRVRDGRVIDTTWVRVHLSDGTSIGIGTDITERKHAEALLHAKEQEFRAIVENAPDQIIRYDREFRRTYVNPAVAKAYGLPAEALIGKPLGSVVQDVGLDVKDEELAQLRQRIATVFDSGKSYEYELNWPLPTGRKYFSVRLFPELDLNGSVVNVLGISRDITERKETEEALDERLRFETLVTELSAAFANLSPNEVDREIDKWLQGLVEFLGVDRASFFQFGEDWTTLYRSHSYAASGIEPLPPPIGMKEQFPWITDQLRRGVTVKWSRIPDDLPEEAGKEKEYAARLGVKSGLNIPVRVGGSVICAITFTSIVTYRDWPDAMVARLRLVGEIFASAVERKRAEAALRKSEEQFRQMAENIREVFWLATADLNKMLYISPAYEAVWGRTRESLYREPRSFSAAIHDEDRARVVAIIERDREQGFEVEYRVVRPDGSIRWIRDRGFPIRDEAGRFYRVAGIAEDITESKRAEENLKATSDHLRALSARLQSAREEEGTRIAREIHDELGSALTSLKWDLEGMEKALSDPKSSPELASMREKAKTMTRLVNSTIEVVRRISAELRPGVLDDLGLVSAIEWQARQFHDRTGIAVHCDCSLDDVDLNQEQSTAVFRILQEALTNVLRHAQATRIDIRAAEAAGEFMLTISDNGKGISEGETSGLQSLGLLGMRERAILIGGKIDIAGIEGKGTVITLRVPIGRAGGPSEPAND